MTDTKILAGFVTQTTEKAIRLVLDAANPGRGIWVPVKKIVTQVESDAASVKITHPGEKAERQGIPMSMEIDLAFLQKIGVAE